MANNSTSLVKGEEQFNGWNRRFLFFCVGIWGLFFLVSLTGNTWVSIVSCKRLQLLGIRSYYFFSLAMADLVFTLSTLFYVLNILLPVNIFNSFTCKLFYYTINTSHGASVFNLLLLTYNRYMAVLCPLKAFTGQKTKSKVRKTLLITWLAALVQYIPLFFLYSVKREEKGGKTPREHCSQTSSPFSSFYYGLVVLFMYLVPLVVIIAAYSKMCVRLCLANHIGTCSTYRRRRKATKLLIIIVALFFILWTPFNVMLVVIFALQINFKNLHIAWGLSTLLVLVNSSINPWLYLVVGRRGKCRAGTLTQRIRLRKF